MRSLSSTFIQIIVIYMYYIIYIIRKTVCLNFALNRFRYDDSLLRYGGIVTPATYPRQVRCSIIIHVEQYSILNEYLINEFLWRIDETTKPGLTTFIMQLAHSQQDASSAHKFLYIYILSHYFDVHKVEM